MEVKRYPFPSTVSTTDIHKWIDDLGSSDESERRNARLSLIREGNAAVPALIEALCIGNTHARWEAAESLAVIRPPSAAPALVRALEDEDHDVRWAAMRALIGLDRKGLEPLLQALIHDFDSVWLREGAHHILNVLKRKRELREPSLRVLRALDGLVPETVSLAAEAAWERLFGYEKDK
jgi:HEAT repeat protein